MSITNGYLTQAALKTALTITATTHDADVDRAIEAASRQIDRWCGRRFYADSTATAKYYTPDHPIILIVDDISSTTSLTVYQETVFGTWGQAWTQDDYTGNYGYRLQPDAAPYWRVEALAGEWQQTRLAVKVTAKWGGSTPTEVAEACLLLATRIYKRKDTPFGILDNPTSGGIPLPRLDPDVRELLAGQVKYGRVSR